MHLARTESAQCLAFSKKDHRRCRLAREPGDKVCKIHTPYFSNWFLEHPPWYKFAWLSQRQQKEYTFQLTGGHVQVPEDHVRFLGNHYFEYYEFLVRVAKIPVCWNLSLLKTCITTILEDILNGRPPSMSIEPFLNTPEDCKVTFRCLLEVWIWENVLVRIREGVPYPTESMLFLWTELTTTSSNWQQLLWSKVLRESIEEGITVCKNTVESNIYRTMGVQLLTLVQETWIPRFHKHFAGPLRERANLFKEELVAQAWHPRRVERWLEAGAELEDL